MKTDTHILARLAASLPGIPIANGMELPNDIQWMPPGKRQISAFSDGKKVVKTVVVDARTADCVNQFLQESLKKAESGTEDKPFFDFNHDDGAASAHPTAFRWAGDDEKTGGVRCVLEWTKPGAEAIAGHAFRRFSPSFFVNANGEVTGAPLNMGGLVNKAAFKTIAPIWSRDAADEGPTEDDMDKETELADLKTAVTARDAEIVNLKATLATQDQTTLVQAKDAEITNLKAKITELEALLAGQAKINAKSIVDAAIACGRLAPQATEIHAKWTERIAKDPTAAELLNAIPVQAALQSVTKPGVRVDAKDGGDKKDEKLPPNEVELWGKK